MDETVMHGKGNFDLATEIDFFTQQLSMILRTAPSQRAVRTLGVSVSHGESG
ncbi:hypothetical protein [Salinispora arenicola]|uniref:hypothetical protein n=1 Tax=Salinispora arenicola TaxID=168697 RepID=UPI0003A5C5B5|nr:hypothetical protein [Salinispora arenicola]